MLAVQQHDLHGDGADNRKGRQHEPHIGEAPRLSFTSATAPAPAIAPVPGASAET